MRRRILLADDSVTIQKVIELTFLDEDYEVKAVSNGDEAIALLPQINPDFVIADIHMPGANGYEVCRRAKQSRPDVPVLLLVGTFEPFDEGQMRSSGADSYLKKPFDSQELLQRVEELLASRPAASPAPAAPPAFPAPPAAAPAFAPAPSPPPFPAAASPPSFTTPEPAPPTWTTEPSPPVFELPPLSGYQEPPAAFAAPELAVDPAWGSFELAPDPEPSPFAMPAASPEPFDREPSFELSPTPEPVFSFQSEEPVFSLDDGEVSYGLKDEIAAPDELSLDEPFERSLPQGPSAPEPEPEPFRPAAGFAWSSPEAAAPPPAEPASPLEDSQTTLTTPPELEPGWPEPEPAPETPAWAAPAATSIYAPAVAAVEPEAVDVPAPVASPIPAAAPVSVDAAPSNGSGRLSDEDVDRIARRLAELLGDRAIREVAWEVIPDMAEVIIRDRLRELEGQADVQ